MTPTPPTDVADFYNAIAPFYDDMTGTRERIVRDEKTFDILVHSNKISDALDAGTGSGAHALLLARLGVNMTGIDIAPAMIDRLTRNAAELGLSVTGLVAPMQNLPTSMNESFDAVFCLGNTFPHLRSSEERRS
ncbi:MAG TPA: class I SAM-dependent methyltransferase, partial [Bacteroidota bacterium]|nr:class I SAM-dependent methyltransferase [Bacteroidota bacterium]